MADYEYTSGGVLVRADFAEGRRGRPETQEIATTVDGRDITLGYVDALELLSPTDSVLAARSPNEYKLYVEVLRDWQVAATLAQRRLAVAGDPHVESGAFEQVAEGNRQPA